MLLSLKPHAAAPDEAVERLTVEVRRSSTRLSLRYELAGDISRLAVPQWIARSRADELWRTTCFEAFVRDGQGPRYFEFNLSPSGQWAAYRFDGYREAMTNQDGVEPTGLELTVEPQLLTLQAVLHLDRLGLSGEGWQLGLSAVIERADGHKSYWALAHPSDMPDFHHPDSFTAELA